MKYKIMIIIVLFTLACEKETATADYIQHYWQGQVELRIAQKMITKGYYESKEYFKPFFIDLSDIRGVWVCPSNLCMPIAMRDVGAVGCATDETIYIIGALHNGQIVFNLSDLGHELQHWMNDRNPVIVDPDLIPELFE